MDSQPIFVDERLRLAPLASKPIHELLKLWARRDRVSGPEAKWCCGLQPHAARERQHEFPLAQILFDERHATHHETDCLSGSIQGQSCIAVFLSTCQSAFSFSKCNRPRCPIGLLGPRLEVKQRDAFHLDILVVQPDSPQVFRCRDRGKVIVKKNVSFRVFSTFNSNVRRAHSRGDVTRAIKAELDVWICVAEPMQARGQPKLGQIRATEQQEKEDLGKVAAKPY